MKSAEFTEWFYEYADEFEPNKLVNRVDAEFCSFHDWMEKALAEAFDAGYAKGHADAWEHHQPKENQND